MKKTSLFLLIFSSLLWGGCTSMKQAGTTVRSYPSDNIRENSELVAKTLLVRQVKYDRESRELMRIQIKVGNIYKKTLAWEYKFRWYDKDHYEVQQSASKWITFNCPPSRDYNIQAIAPSPDVKDFDLMIRFPDTW